MFLNPWSLSKISFILLIIRQSCPILYNVLMVTIVIPIAITITMLLSLIIILISVANLCTLKEGFNFVTYKKLNWWNRFSVFFFLFFSFPYIKSNHRNINSKVILVHFYTLCFHSHASCTCIFFLIHFTSSLEYSSVCKALGWSPSQKCWIVIIKQLISPLTNEYILFIEFIDANMV